MSKQLAVIKDEFHEALQKFASFWDIIKGRQDSQVRANVILNPKMPQTSTNLSADQVDFVTICMGISVHFPEMKPLEDLCNQFLLASVSKEGWGVDRMIAYEQAIGEKRLLQLGLKNPQEQAQQDKKSNVKV